MRHHYDSVTELGYSSCASPSDALRRTLAAVSTASDSRASAPAAASPCSPVTGMTGLGLSGSLGLGGLSGAGGSSGVWLFLTVMVTLPLSSVSVVASF